MLCVRRDTRYKSKKALFLTTTFSPIKGNISVSNVDAINHPKHYNKGIETTDYICSWDMDFCEGNVEKYVTRWKYKNGIEDLRKAQWYLNKLIKDYDNEQTDR